MADVIPPVQPGEPFGRYLLRCACAFYDCEPDARTVASVSARRVTACILNEFGWSLARIGARIGAEHGTVRHALRAAKTQRQNDAEFQVIECALRRAALTWLQAVGSGDQP